MVCVCSQNLATFGVILLVARGAIAITNRDGTSREDKYESAPGDLEPNKEDYTWSQNYTTWMNNTDYAEFDAFKKLPNDTTWMSSEEAESDQESYSSNQQYTKEWTNNDDSYQQDTKEESAYDNNTKYQQDTKEEGAYDSNTKYQQDEKEVGDSDNYNKYQENPNEEGNFDNSNTNQQGSNEEGNFDNGNGNQQGPKEESGIDWCPDGGMREKYLAFFVDDEGQRHFSEELLKLIKADKKTDEMLHLLTNDFKDISEKFFRNVSLKSSVYDFKQMIQCFMNMSSREIPNVITALIDTFSLQPLEFDTYAHIIRVLSTDTLAKLVQNAESTDALIAICQKLINHLPCNSTFTALRELKKSDKSCLNINGVPAKTKLANLILNANSLPRLWDDQLWVDMVIDHMDVLVEKHHLIEIMPDQVLLKMWQQITIYCEELKKGKDIFVERMENIFEALDVDLKNEYKPAMKEILRDCGGDVSKYSTKEEEVKEYKHGKTKMTAKKSAEMAKNLHDVVQKPVSEYTKEEIVQYIEFLALSKKDMKELDPFALEEAICEIGKLKNLNKGVLRALFWTMNMKIEKYKDPKAFEMLTVDDINCLGNILSVLPKNKIKDINNKELYAAINSGLLKTAKFNCKVAYIIMEKYKKITQNAQGGFQSTELVNFGSILKCLKAEDWEHSHITADVIEAIDCAVGDNRLPKSVVSAIFRKIAQQENAKVVLDKIAHSNFGKYLQVKRKAQIIAERLKSGHDAPEEFVECNCKEAKRCFHVLLNVLGDFSLWELDWIEKLKGSTLWHGLNSKMIDNLPDFWLEEFDLEHFESQNCSSVKQMKNLRMRYQEIKKEIEIEGGHSGTLDEEEEESSITLVYRSPDTFTTSNEQKLEETCKKMGEVDINRVPQDIIKSKLEICKDVCTDEATTSRHYEECGSLLCGMNTDQIATMDISILQNHASTLCEKCQWSDEQRKALIKRCFEVTAIKTNLDVLDVCVIGVCIKYLTEDQFYQTSADVLMSSVKCVSESSLEQQSAEEKREEWGIHPTEEQKETSLEQDEVYGETMIQSFALILRRRKRSGELKISCDDLMSLNGAVVALTSDDISQMPSQELENCLDMFGQITTWSTEQKRSILDRLTDDMMFGLVENWSTEIILQAGTVIQGLTLNEIKTLHLNLALMESLGQHAGWSEGQKKEMLQRYLDLYKPVQGVFELSANEIRVFGHFICGLTTDQIAAIDVAVYKNASEEIGQVTSCNELQLIEWAKKAKDAFGDVSTWDEATVQLVGSIIGGLMEEDLSNLNEDHIDSIEPALVPYIPPSTLEKFTAAQLEFFSSNQVQAMTDSQREALNEEQLNAVNRVMTTITGGLNSQGLKSAGISSLLLTAMAFAIKFVD